MIYRTPEMFEKIERYLSNELNEEDLLLFEKEIASSKELAKEVELHRSLKEHVSDTDTLEFKKRLQAIETNFPNTRATKRNFKWAIAAAIIVVLCLSVVALFIKNANTGNLFDEYYQPYPVRIERGSGEDLMSIFRLYQQEDYQTILPKIRALVEAEPKNDVYRLYLGNCYLNTDNYEKAISEFIKVKIGTQYYEDSRWYVAMSYLKMQNLQKVREVLDDVIELDGAHKANAERLLKDL